MIVYILFLIGFYSSSPGQDIRVSASFDTSRIFIGDQLKYSLSIEQPDNVILNLPVFKDTLVKNIEIISGPVTDTVKNEKGTLIIKQEYLITSFDSGRYQVWPVFAELKGPDGIKRFYSDYSYLEVLRPDIAPADTTLKIYDIISPYRAPVTIGEILPWVLGLIAAIVIAYFAIRYIKKLRKEPSETEIIVLKDPAHVIALRELELLKELRLWQKGEVKQYYSSLTEILRKYLENRFSVFSLELTTSETLDALLKTGFRKDKSYENLKTVLSGADMVKFAKHNPEPTENEAYFQTAWDFIIETKMEEEPEAVKSPDEKGGDS